MKSTISISGKFLRLWVIAIPAVMIPLSVSAQNAGADSLLQQASLDKVVHYALSHQPAVQQAEIDEEITNKVIRGKIADWYPQLNFNYGYQRFLELQKTVFNGTVIPIGVKNTSYAQFTATQTIFNRDVLLAASTASKVRVQALQNTSRSKIDVVVNVTKAFYDVLATSQQVKVSEESIARLQRSLKDARSRYETGIADKTDYKRATILLGNAQASLKSNVELQKYKESYLKTLMGYPSAQDLPLQYDTLEMESLIELDTLEEVNYANHIDYQILSTQKELQNANIKYSNWALLPSLNAFGYYNLNYQNNNFNELYDKRYPYSYVGATLSFPLFQGGKRTAKIQEQKLAMDRLDVTQENLQNVLRTEYARALASYKSNLKYYLTQKENVDLANEVYDIIQLQYLNGIRPYLDVTVAETDLRTTRINYFDSLYQVLASKMDVLSALGQISY